ncbi:MAG: ABC transporter permease [Candidatus Pacearchaeota archaeon]
MINPINSILSISRKFYSYLKKDFLLMVKRKKYLYLLILIPLLIGLIFIFFLNPSPANIKVGVCDNDQTSYSRQAVSDLKGFNTIFLPIENCTQNLLSQIKSKQISLGLEIPKGFSQNLLNLKQVKIIMYYDNTDIAFANFISWKVDVSMEPYERSILNALNTELKARVSAIRTGVDFMLELTEDYKTAQSRIQKIDSDLKKIEEIETEFILNPVWTEHKPIYTEKTKDAGFAFIFPIIALFIVLMLSSSSFIYDKKTNFLVRVKSSTSPIIYIFAKLVFFFVITLINFMIIYILFLLYGSSYNLSFLKILNLLAFISITNTLLGMLIGLVSDNEGVAILFSFIVSFPFMLLSGIFYPVQTMPLLVQYFAKIIPLNYQITYSKSVILFDQSIGFNWLWIALVLVILVYYFITRKH